MGCREEEVELCMGIFIVWRWLPWRHCCGWRGAFRGLIDTKLRRIV